MADQYQLTNWILENLNRLDLQVRELSWIESYFPGWTDLAATITIKGQKYVGRGSDQDKDTALCKAVCEGIERALCHQGSFSSTGIAGHPDPGQAKRNAQEEFIERVSLFHHVQLRMPAYGVHSRKLVLDDALGADLSLTLHQLKLNSPNGFYVVLSLAEGVSTHQKIGGILGLGCSQTEETAVTKSRIECMRNVATLPSRQLEPISQATFDKLIRPSATERQRLLANVDYCTDLLKWLLSTPTYGPKNSGTVPIIGYSWSALPLPDGLPEECPLHFYRCHDPNDASLVLDFVG